MAYQLQDQVVYGVHGVCTIVDLEQRVVDRRKVEYYVLEPKEQPGARFYVPTQNKVAVSKLRPLLNREELEELLQSDATHQDTWIPDENLRKQKYRELINSGDRAALICMVRSLHAHKESQMAAGRKFHLCDENFLKDAQKLLNSEFSLILGMPQNELQEYMRSKLENI